jgi:uncharacterized membrane protein YkoI
MKKLITITGITALILVGGLIGLMQSPVFASNSAMERAIVRSMDQGVPFNMPPVTLDQAQATVMAAHPGAAIIRVQLHGPVSEPVWRFELLQSDGSRIDVRVDAETGLILKTAENGGPLTIPTIGFSQAKTTILTQYPGASIIKADLVRENDVLMWKFHLLTSDGKLVKASLNATTGALVQNEVIKVTASPAISLAEARAKVMAEFPGATIERAQFKDDESPTVWHFRLITADGMEARVDVDATSGELLEIRVKDSGGDRSGPGNGRPLFNEREDRRGEIRDAERDGRLDVRPEDKRGEVRDAERDDRLDVRPEGKRGGRGPG